MDFNTKVKLGRTGLQVGRLGISSSFGAPARAFEEAFEKGCNYFTWGTKNIQQMRENLQVLDSGPMTETELTRMRKIGDYIYGKPVLK
jgi:aryl-alcohol dehydrogenase-like predicted oxidoreductase